jgi:hypothetical protein
MKIQFAGAALLGLALALAVTPLLSSPVMAQNGKTVTKAAQYDWFAKPKVAAKPQAAPKIVLVRYLGYGSYICSPAGYGHTSTCFQRGH